MKNKIFIVIAVVFLASRFLGLGQIYHQDEYKWAMIVNPIFNLQSESNHPPLVGLLYHLTGEAFGYDHLRILPFIFSLLGLILAYLLVKKLYGKKAALITSSILLVSVYNFIASLQIDFDGALLPFWGLLAVYAFYHLDFRHICDRKNYRWLVILCVSLVGGFLTKLSFFIIVAALATEYYLVYRPKIKDLLKLLVAFGGVVLAVALAVLAINAFYPGVQATRFLLYVKNFSFLNFASRNWSQVMFLTIKSLVLASPLLLGGYFLINRQNWQKYRFWLIFLLYNVLFYLVVFDFSNRTIERYLMFLIVPGAIIGGSLVAENLALEKIKNLWLKILGIGGSLFLLGVWILSLSYKILPLNPKSAYLAQMKNLDLKFLIPITGGSGPVGFYVSVLMVVVTFLVTLGALAVFRLTKKQNCRALLVLIFVIGGIFYNLLLDGEFLAGWLYGNVNQLAKEALTYVVSSQNISKTVTYYDLGGYELKLSGKYQRRFYTDPKFTAKNQDLLPQEKSYYLVVDFPQIDKQSFYWQYFRQCAIVYFSQDREVAAYVFDCRQEDKKVFE
jgi:MFS family permease